MPLPSEFTARMSDLLPDFEKFSASYADAPLTGLRANTLKISAEKLKSLVLDIGERVDWCADGFYYDAASFRPGKSPYYHAGLYYIQEPSAMSPAAVMDVLPGHRVLDLCAAPGGKSTQLAAKLAGKGVLAANDVSASRARALLKNIELNGVTNSVITNETPARLAARFAGYFDRILVDAPCSGEGMFRRDPDAMKAWAARKPGACLALQREILHFAAIMLKPGGRLMYSTCTFAPEENELMISEFLSSHADFAGVAISHADYGIEPGIYNEEYTARIWPHRQKGEGHFLAYLQRLEDDKTSNPIRWKLNMTPNPIGQKLESAYLRRNPSEYTDFCDKYLNFTPAPVARHGNSLHMPPDAGLPSLDGLRVLREGLYLGDVLTKRFEPSQAFAISLRSDDVRHCIDFPSDSGDLYRYLKGESFEPSSATATDGWNLVSADGFPIGWAKVSNGRLKNKYPRGWLLN